MSNELIKVQERSGVETVNARELWEGLGSRQDFSTWIKSRLEGFEKDKEYLLHNFMEQMPSGAKNKTDYYLTIETAKHICLMERNEIGKKYRTYFIELEKRVKGLYSLDVPKTYAEALRLAADQADLIDKQTLRIEQDKPKVEFYDAVTGSSDTIDMKTVAKVLDMGIGRNKLFAVLRYHKILMRNNEPYQSYVDAKYFNVIISEYAVDGEVHINRKTVVTPLGVDFIRKRVLKSKEDGIFDSILAVEAKE